MNVFRKLPTLPNVLMRHDDSVVTDPLKPESREERRMSTFPIPEIDDHWLQELQDPPNKMHKNENCVSFVSSFSGRTPTIPPSIVEDLDYERPGCCWFCCCCRHDDGV